jgi:hypothetical protein
VKPIALESVEAFSRMFCPDCGKEPYSLILSVIPEGLNGFYFYNDNCFKAEGYRLYTATRGKQSWKLVHHWNVDDLPFEDGTDTVHHSSSWLDIHYFEPLAAPDRPSAFAFAAKIARAIARDRIRLGW